MGFQRDGGHLTVFREGYEDEQKAKHWSSLPPGGAGRLGLMNFFLTFLHARGGAEDIGVQQSEIALRKHHVYALLTIA